MSSFAFGLHAAAQDVQWKITTSYTSQAESGYPLTNTYDGNTNTYWHSPWSSGSTSFPITITLGMNEVHQRGQDKKIMRGALQSIAHY